MNQFSCNTYVRGTNARNLCVCPSLSQASKNAISYVSPQQNWRRGLNSFCLEVWVLGRGAGGGTGGEMAQTMYTHMNKCINN
jgi:hypothetical protein